MTPQGINNINTIQGDVMTDIFDALGIGSARRQQAFNSAEAAKSRMFEEYMSNTAYQRAVDDIKAAGLNPSMLYANGAAGGASTPSSASGSAGVARNSNLISQIGTFINSVNNARAIDMKTKQNQMNNEKSLYNTVGSILEKMIFKK